MIGGDPAGVAHLYVHLPFCASRCGYCAFVVEVGREDARDAYLHAVLAELDRERAVLGALDTVYLGGGTPTLMGADRLARLLGAIAPMLAPGAEVTVEANPETMDDALAAALAGAGVTRVSLGAQSFDPQVLKALGRIHVPADVQRAAEELHACGLDNFNLDLMFALPGQGREGALADLRQALALQPAHLSHYQLTLEPGTPFAALPPANLPDDDLAWAMQQDCHAQLAAQGFAQYEVSAFARAGRQCVHNLNYWQFGDYLGLGAGAHGKLTTADGDIVRTTQQREPRRYQARPVEGLQRRVVPPADLPFEFLMNSLRLVEGFDLSLFTARTGLPQAALLAGLQREQARGMLEPVDGRWRATAQGQRFLNDVIGAFLPDTNSQAVTGA